jgi:hypothetical protein
MENPFDHSVLTRCRLGAADEHVAKVWNGPMDTRHQPGHLAHVGDARDDTAHDRQAGPESLVGKEAAWSHHLKRPGLHFDSGQSCRFVDRNPVLERVDLHAWTDLPKKDLSCFWSWRLAPEEFSGEHAAAGSADAHQLGSGTGPVDEHGDRFGDHPVKAVITIGQFEDIPMLDRDLVHHPRRTHVGASPLKHQCRDVHSGYLRAEAAGDFDGRGRHAAADVENSLFRRKLRHAYERLRGVATARMNHALSKQCHELVRIEPGDIG